MKRSFVLLLALCGLAFPVAAIAFVSGIDDVNPNISDAQQRQIDAAITTYYQHPSVAKIDTVLDIMNTTDLLRKKTSWSPLVGFLTIVFQHNQKHLFHWMGRNDYINYAQDVFVTALLHAKLKETALVFARAHRWTGPKLERVKGDLDMLDFAHMDVTLPGHIDALWGAFFASGDRVYVNEIIDVLFDTRDEPLGTPDQPRPSDAPKENKRLAEATLRQYAAQHKPVRNAIKARIAAEKTKAKRDVLRQLLVPAPPVSP